MLIRLFKIFSRYNPKEKNGGRSFFISVCKHFKYFLVLFLFNFKTLNIFHFNNFNNKFLIGYLFIKHFNRVQVI